MNNGVILSILFLLLLFFLAIVTTSITSMIFVSIFFTPKSVLEEISRIISPQKGDTVVDLGCGDGRVLISLAKQAKIKGYGFDISPLMPILSKIRKTFSKQYRADITFDVASFFDLKLNDYDIIYCNLNPQSMEILGKKFDRVLKGTTVYSYRLEIPGRAYTKKHILSNRVELFEYHY